MTSSREHSEATAPNTRPRTSPQHKLELEAGKRALETHAAHPAAATAAAAASARALVVVQGIQSSYDASHAPSPWPPSPSTLSPLARCCRRSSRSIQTRPRGPTSTSTSFAPLCDHASRTTARTPAVQLPARQDLPLGDFAQGVRGIARTRQFAPVTSSPFSSAAGPRTTSRSSASRAPWARGSRLHAPFPPTRSSCRRLPASRTHFQTARDRERERALPFPLEGYGPPYFAAPFVDRELLSSPRAAAAPKTKGDSGEHVRASRVRTPAADRLFVVQCCWSSFPGTSIARRGPGGRLPLHKIGRIHRHRRANSTRTRSSRT
jgi:hypothetical protein